MGEGGRGQASADAVLQGDVAVWRRTLGRPSVQRAAVLALDDDLLGHVNQPPGEVAAAGGVQRGVGQALAGAVSGEEVLQRGKPLAEVGLHRQFDDVGASGSAHQPAHSGHLVDLRNVALGAGQGHDADAAVVGQVAAHQVGGLEGGLVPGVHNLGVALVFRDEPHFVFGLVLVNPLLGFGHYHRLLRRHLDVVDGDGDSRVGGVPEAQVLDAVQHFRRLVVGQQAVEIGCQGVQGTAVDELVLDADCLRQVLVEDELFGQDRVEFQAAQGGLVVPAAVIAAADAPDVNWRPQVYFAGVVGVAGLGDVGELAPGSLYVGAILRRVGVRQIVAAHHHVQRGCHQGVAGSGRQHIVGA